MFFSITALDPAQILFEEFPPEKCLQSTDAELVDVIHTNSNKDGSIAGLYNNELGFVDALGDVDFYPNGGGPTQPGCEPFKSDSMFCI